jgi:hypothetical protein
MNALRLSLIVALAWVSAARAETLTCSTSFQQRYKGPGARAWPHSSF